MTNLRTVQLLGLPEAGALASTDWMMLQKEDEAFASRTTYLLLAALMRELLHTEVVTPLVIDDGVVNIDWSLSNMFSLALSEDVTSVTESNKPAAGYGQGISILIAQDDDTPHTIEGFPASWKFFGDPYAASSDPGAIDELCAAVYASGGPTIVKFANGAA
jgi:hypothetical protein